jgi:streptogramin lyase
MSFQQTYTYLVSNIVVGTDVFNGMVLAPDGNVITVPSGSNIYVINPTSGISTNVGPIAGSVTNLFRGGALLPSGNIVFAPGTSGNVGMFDPVALTYSNSIPTGTSGLAFSGATLLPSGQVVFTPYDSANVGVLDAFAPVSQEFCLAPYFNKF